MKPVTGVHGAFVADFGTAAEGRGCSSGFHRGNGRWAMHGAGSGRRNGDVDTPEGTIANTQSRGGFGNVGRGVDRARAASPGASYGYDDTKYGIPFVEEGLVELTPRRHMFGVKAGASELSGPLEGYRVRLCLTPVQARGTRRRRSGHQLRKRHRRNQPPGASSTGRATVWNDRRLVSEPVFRCDRRRSAVAASQGEGICRRSFMRS